MTPEEFKNLWNKRAPLTRFHKNAVTKSHIPESAKQFLIEAGLTYVIYTGPIDKELPRLPDAVGSRATLPSSFKRYRVLGEKYPYCFDCIDEEEGGKVVMVGLPEEGEEPEIRFHNSSVQQYAACWLTWTDFYAAWETTRVVYPEDFDQLEATIREIDPAALDGEDCIWPERIVALKSGDIF